MKTSELTLRRMAIEDIDVVHDLDTRSFPTPWPKKSYHFELNENKTAHAWVAEVETPEGKKIVGMVVVWLLVNQAHIATLAVDEDYRRQRVAFKMLCASLGHLVKQGAISATLEVRESNGVAQILYRRFGFQLVGRRPAYYKNNGEDAILMTLNHLDDDHLSIIRCK